MKGEMARPLMIGAVGLLGIAAAVAWPGAPSSSTRVPTRPGKRHVEMASMEAVKAEVRERAPVLVASAAPSFNSYQGLLKQNPFAPKLPAKAPAAGPKTPAPSLPPAGVLVGPPAPSATPPAPPAPPAAPPEPPDPLKDWIYSGTVAIGDDIYAVMENKTTHRGEYVKTGDPFEGGTVQTIAQGALALSLNGQVRNLPKSTAFNATPLNAPAGAGNGQPGGAPNGGQPGGAPGAGGPWGGPTKPGGKSPSGTPGATPAPTAPGATPVMAPMVLDAPASAGSSVTIRTVPRQ
jgi:hypothetical protein